MYMINLPNLLNIQFIWVKHKNEYQYEVRNFICNYQNQGPQWLLSFRIGWELGNYNHNLVHLTIGNDIFHIWFSKFSWLKYANEINKSKEKHK